MSIILNGTTGITTPALDSVAPFSSADMPAGSVLQVVNTTLTTATSVTGAGFQEITGLTAVITPTSASSKILVAVCFGRIGINTALGGTAAFRLMRDTTVVGAGTPAGSQIATSFIATSNTNSNYSAGGLSTQFLDSPSSTATITYSVQALGEGDTLVYFNRSYTGGTGATTYEAASASTITLMEIAA